MFADSNRLSQLQETAITHGSKYILQLYAGMQRRHDVGSYTNKLIDWMQSMISALGVLLVQNRSLIGMMVVLRTPPKDIGCICGCAINGSTALYSKETGSEAKTNTTNTAIQKNALAGFTAFRRIDGRIDSR